MNHLDALCFGALKADIIVRDNFIWQAVKSDEKVHMKTGNLLPGGSAANIAVGLARLGTKAGLLSYISHDGLGEFLQKVLAKEKVQLFSKPGPAPTPFTVIVTSLNKRVLLSSSSPDQKIKLPSQFFSQHRAKFIIASGIHIHHLDALNNAFNRFKAQQRVFLPAPELCIKKPQGFLKALKKTDVMQLNKVEAGYLLKSQGGWQDKNISQIASFGPKRIIVTKGRQGAIYWDKNSGIIKVKAKPVKVIEATGAGDAFCTGFIFGLLQKKSVAKCLRLGVRSAACSITKIGGQAGLPTRKELGVI